METINSTTPPSAAVQAARQEIYRLLALCATDPRAERWSGLAEPNLQESVKLGEETLAQVDGSPVGGLAPGELGLGYLKPSALLSFIKGNAARNLRKLAHRSTQNAA